MSIVKHIILLMILAKDLILDLAIFASSCLWISWVPQMNLNISLSFLLDFYYVFLHL